MIPVLWNEVEHSTSHLCTHGGHLLHPPIYGFNWDLKRRRGLST